MNRYQRKPDPNKKPTQKALNIEQIWKNQPDDVVSLTPPPQNSSAEAPFNGLLYNIKFVGNISFAVPLDRGVVSLIQRKTLPFDEKNMTRQKVELVILGRDESFKVFVWVIPLFMDGVLCNHIYAADTENQNLLLEHRNPVKSEQNGPYYI